ncbi:SPRY domain-containing SOCS box protein 3 isoform X2 [Vulpes vulpes]|uniref:SPRY domain-containing SOCS box protein 3 n=1 Tax=Vulpes vulpes TaxID=9627 RepID=A0A3Q7R4Q2_VULVU|nr:SPRY domain-containing SOCS box protein 3 isoform X2 [Vulpes vulpes]XP_041603394.1 SPRY domain-containing SOCS box protein 3 isoform X1 [Vulpes lagopus]
MVEMPFVKVDERGGARQGARCPRDRPSPERGQDTCSRVMGIWTVLHALCSAFVKILFTMARRPRSSRAWHFVLSAAHRDTDARAVALAGTANWGYDSDGQHSDSDSDPESSALPPPIPSAVPVTGESFCDCDSQSEASLCGSLHVVHRGKDKDCRCGEEDEYFDWVWDDLNKSSATLLSCDNRKVNFHMEYSCGTAAIRGTKELGEGQHFWEIKMTSPVYGTDMMVGIGTSDVDLDKYHHTFCSLLGRDEDSWGLSYTGLLHHKGDKTSFSSRFGQGSIIGVHLDTWHGTLTFFKNRKCIGVAATKLQNKKFYPMVCSTAAKSSMKVIRSCASITSLQYLCCYRLRQLRPDSGDTLEGLPLPPGLKQVLHHKLGWVLSMSCGRHKPPAPSPKATATPGSPEPRHCQRKRYRRT